MLSAAVVMGTFKVKGQPKAIVLVATLFHNQTSFQTIFQIKYTIWDSA